MPRRQVPVLVAHLPAEAKRLKPGPPIAPLRKQALKSDEPKAEEHLSRSVNKNAVAPTYLSQITLQQVTKPGVGLTGGMQFGSWQPGVAEMLPK